MGFPLDYKENMKREVESHNKYRFYKHIQGQVSIRIRYHSRVINFSPKTRLQPQGEIPKIPPKVQGQKPESDTEI